MSDEKDVLPSDVEDGGLKPQHPDTRKPPTPPPADDKKVEEDPSEQPS